MSRRAKIVVTDFTFADFGRYRDELRGLDTELVTPLDVGLERIPDQMRDADALIHEYLHLTADVLESLRYCRVIAHHGKGVDHIDVAAATALGICVANVPDASVREVPEHLFALLLAVARKIITYDRAVRRGDWRLQLGEPLYRLHGKTLGLVGFGNLARYAARMARGLGMRVVAYARRPDRDLGRLLEVEFVPVDQVFSAADAVAVILPLTDETRGLVGRELLALMRPTAILLNVSRGGIIDEVALAEALAAGRILGAGLDVLAEEPPRPDDPLLQLDNVVLTPHCAWYSEEGRDDVERRTAREVARVLGGGWPDSWVNPEVQEIYTQRWQGGER